MKTPTTLIALVLPLSLVGCPGSSKTPNAPSGLALEGSGSGGGGESKDESADESADGYGRGSLSGSASASIGAPGGLMRGSIQPDPKSSCVAVSQRQRECTDSFIPELVDARIRLDLPEGIAKRAKTEGRDAIIAEALSEWSSSSLDEAIEFNCEELVESTDPEELEPILVGGEDCLGESDCAVFAECIVPVLEGQLE